MQEARLAQQMGIRVEDEPATTRQRNGNAGENGTCGTLSSEEIAAVYKVWCQPPEQAHPQLNGTQIKLYERLNGRY